MSNLYERIDSLCKGEKTNVTALCKELGLARSSLSELKAGRTKSLSSQYLQQIADRFKVSTRYLLTGEDQKENPATKRGDEVSEAKKAFIQELSQLDDSEIQRAHDIVKYILSERGK